MRNCKAIGSRSISACVLLLLLASLANGQQPFVTDDAETTPKHHFHFEFSNEFDLLQHSSFPNRKQNTADSELDYGLLDRLEIGIDFPLLTIYSTTGTLRRRVSGLGDTNLSVKYNFVRENDNSRMPALAVTFNVELPTGDTTRQLGSGLADYYLNGILQRSLDRTTKLRLNGGVLFSGNETTGVVGLKSRGTVFTGGGSLVRQVKPSLQLGVELTGAVTGNFQLGKGRLQSLVGGNYQFKKKASFDFGIVAGKLAASPSLGVQLGISIDF